MRIIAGEFRSRRILTPPPELDVRPMPDRVRESIFSILRGHTEGASVFDAFAGTGSIGLEALSRGAARVVFVEKDKRAAAMLRANIEMLGVEDRTELVIGDALGAGAISRCPRPCTLAFFDPPYPLVRTELGLARVRDAVGSVVARLSDDGYALLRTPWPAMLNVADDDQPVEPLSPRKRERERRAPKGRWDLVLERESRHPRRARMDEEPEADEPGPASGDGDHPGAIPPVPMVLSIEGAIGPETHIYGTMAVHLYMRRR